MSDPAQDHLFYNGFPYCSALPDQRFVQGQLPYTFVGPVASKGFWTHSPFAKAMAYISTSTLHPTPSTSTQSHSQPQNQRIHSVQPAPPSMSSISVHQPHHPGRRPRSLFIADLSQCLLEFVVQLLPPQEEVAVKEDVRSAIRLFSVDTTTPSLHTAHT